MSGSAKRLEQALGLWEETCLSWSILAHLQKEKKIDDSSPDYVPLAGPLVHWPYFRRYLLDSFNESAFDFGRFIGPPRVVQALKLSGSAMAYLPQALANWTRRSRRVYHLTEELQHLLLMTSLKEITWNDVHWPFESFAVTLDTPIYDGRGVGYDTILVSREIDPDTGESCIGFRLFSNEYGDYKPMSREEKAKALKAIERKKWDTAQHLVSKKHTDEKDMHASVFYIRPEHMTLPVTKAIATVIDFSEEENLNRLLQRPDDLAHAHWDFGAKLVVGLCMYLRSLPKGSPHTPEWKKIQRKPSVDLHAITNEAAVCSVSSVYTFTPEEWGILRAARGSAKAYYELRVHFREGHWRRSPGRGHEPDAPYDVQVRPTIVRPDRLLAGAVPSGTEKNFSM